MTEDLDVFFSDFAVDVVSGDSTFKGILDQPDEIVGQFGISTEYVLTCKSSDVSGLDNGSTVTIDSADYTVRDVRKLDDGKLSKLSLSKV
jgi:hypothetical protein